MLAPTLITLPPEILSHIFSYLVFKDITTVSPSQSLLPYYRSIIYRSVFIVKELDYNSFSATLKAQPFLAKLIIKFDIDFRDDSFQRSIEASKLVSNIKIMTNLRWLGIGQAPYSVTTVLSKGILRNYLPRLRHFNISEEYSTITTHSSLKILFLVSQLTQVESLSIEIDNEEADEPLSVPDAEEDEALSLLNFDHIRYLNIQGQLNTPFLVRILEQFKKIRSLTLRTTASDSLDLTPIFKYSFLEALHLLDCDPEGSNVEFSQQILSFTGLKELSIGDGTLFSGEKLPLLSSLLSLRTLNLGVELWNEESKLKAIINLLESGQSKISSLRNLNLNTRLSWYHTRPEGSRWKGTHLEDNELKSWKWDCINQQIMVIPAEQDLVELFQDAERNKIKIGGQILEVEWPKLGRPRVIG